MAITFAKLQPKVVMIGSLLEASGQEGHEIVSVFDESTDIVNQYFSIEKPECYTEYINMTVIDMWIRRHWFIQCKIFVLQRDIYI